jgi:hypothetical protein
LALALISFGLMPAKLRRGGRLDFPDCFTNYGSMNAAVKIRRDFVFRVCPIGKAISLVKNRDQDRAENWA